MNRAQRTVLAIAVGLVCATVPVAVNRHLTRSGGWFAYAPNTDVAFESEQETTIWREAIVWGFATGVWALVSVRIFRSHDNAPPEA